ncbi:PIN domain-containing protein [Streptomyces cyaneofuscatus]|uniref:PIN domain-containing protein n=1 Tax=Streptomyces cyaneofuscatus TaxID=66883 RepID=UPI002D7A18E5|nr:PIN domain-containing protein [Streptomyces cyaneofuscatus]WRO11639.1 PIN domain-containing protein [Streptomyces cyaneofuscatus]
MQRVVLDTCVLYPNYLRDTLLRLAEAELYEPLWSADILDELARNVAERIGPLKAKGLVDAMAGAFPESLVTGYAALLSAMTNDPKDRHVLAAAVGGDAHAVVTLNLKDFPAAAAEPYGIEVLHPDDFLLDMLDLAPVEMNAVLRTQLSSYRREPRDLHGLLDRIGAGGAPQFAAEFRRRL